MVKVLLGSPGVGFELTDEQINTLVEMAVITYAPYYAGTSMLVRTPVNGVINLADDHVVEVCKVFDTTSTLAASDSMLFANANLDREIFDLNYRVKFDMVSAAIASYTRSEYESVIDKGFRYVDGKLFVDDFSGSPLTIECLKEISSLSDITTEFGIQWVLKYTVALVKCSIGEIRRKFTFNNAPYTIDGDTIAAEGTSEKQALEEQLGNNGSAGFFVVLR
jgi:hypothetical protein